VLHVARIARMAAHPGRERLVVGEQAGVVASLRQSRGLRLGVDVEQTHGIA
jgi:hypothetical protein